MENNESFKNVYLSLLFAMEYHPYNIKMNIYGRHQHSFLYIIEGEYNYRFEKQFFTARTGDLLYIPKGSVHSYEIVSNTTHCLQVEFAIQGGNLSFSSHPIKLQNCENAETLIRNIVELFGTNQPSDFFEAQSCLYKLFAALTVQIYKALDKESRIQPAVTYIENHYKEKFDIDLLAKLCFMSQSQLRRNFKKEYNMSPITYKNSFRIEKAKSMLLYGISDIGETAEELGFDNIYAFSHMFKKYSGLSPRQFAKNRNK